MPPETAPVSPAAGAVITVTAGNRLARWLHEEHARAVIAHGATAWETPAILPWAAWLETLWDEVLETGAFGRHPPMRLGDGQALALWESIIRDWAGEQSLLQPSATAELAFDAWQRMHEWRVPDPSGGSEDHRAFAAWAGKFREVCERHHWLDGARLTEALIPPVRERRLALPAHIRLRGFDEITPSQQALIDALREAGVAVEGEDSLPPPAKAVRTVLPTLRDEIEAAARFARERIERNPQARVGIVVPELARHRELIVRVFDDILAPSTRLPGGARHRRPYNVSLGRALADVSPVAQALALLSESTHVHRTGTIHLEVACAWIGSPYLDGAEAEWGARASLERHLREIGEPVANLKFVLHLAQGQGHGVASCPRLAGHLQRWRQSLSQVPARAMPSQWVPVLTDLLAAAGWPGDRPRDSHEHQALEHWRELLGELRRYDAVTGVMGFEGIVARVQAMARSVIFQPQSPMVPVQVLGLLEASGLAFDHLWVLGLQDDNWPATPRPQPFIPVAVQRRLGMPHATPEREYAYARERTARLTGAAPEVVFSSARQEGDRLLSPSALLMELPAQPVDSLGLSASPRHAELIHRRAQMESWRDDHAPPLAAAEAAGGTRLFRLQSACPFRALAELRLHAEPLPSAGIGLDPMDRGTLVHRALEAFWEAVGDQATLAGMDDAALSARIGEAVEGAIERFARHRPFTFTARFRELERERLAILLHEWLTLERQRPPFEVLARESRRLLTVGPLTVSAAIDRIDRLADGALVVTDYKTGKAGVADWLGERPREPQVPLYAVYGAGEPVSALAYAQVRRGECQWRGLSSQEIELPGIKPATQADTGFASWDELHRHWRTVLERLAQAFRDGEAAVDPRDANECRRCHLPSLCRVREREHREGRMSVDGDNDD